MSAPIPTAEDWLGEREKLQAEVERLREERRRLRAVAVVAEALVNHEMGTTFQTLANAVLIWRHRRGRAAR